MKTILLFLMLLWAPTLFAQQYPNSQFKRWNEWGCPEDWNCNNDQDCKGKVRIADKINGGVLLEVQHCFDLKKTDRSNNVNISYDELTAKINKGKKVTVRFQYSFTPKGSDQAYVKIDADFDEEINQNFPEFLYGSSKDGWLKPAQKIWMECKLNFNSSGVNFIAPQHCFANSIRTTFGIMPGKKEEDVTKGSQLTIHQIVLNIE